MKRMRKAGIEAGITDPLTGELIPFPYMPRVAELSAGWRRFSTAEKIEHLLGMDLTRVYEILSWPLDDLDPLQRALRTQVWRVVFTFGLRAMLNGEFYRERDRKAALEELARRLGEDGTGEV